MASVNTSAPVTTSGAASVSSSTASAASLSTSAPSATSSASVGTTASATTSDAASESMSTASAASSASVGTSASATTSGAASVTTSASVTSASTSAPSATSVALVASVSTSATTSTHGAASGSTSGLLATATATTRSTICADNATPTSSDCSPVSTPTAQRHGRKPIAMSTGKKTRGEASSPVSENEGPVKQRAATVVGDAADQDVLDPKPSATSASTWASLPTRSASALLAAVLADTADNLSVELSTVCREASRTITSASVTPAATPLLTFAAALSTRSVIPSAWTSAVHATALPPSHPHQARLRRRNKPVATPGHLIPTSTSNSTRTSTSVTLPYQSS